MKKIYLKFAIPVFVVSLIFGCGRVRTYVVETERVDQNLSSGNMGYLSGTPSDEEINRPRKLTRQTYVTEVELGSYKTQREPGKTKMVAKAEKEPVTEPISGAVSEEVVGTASSGEQSFTMYTVTPNDTLGGIAVKFYGSSKKWKKIYEANADKLKTPDKIYAGQVLKIPVE